MENFGKWFAGAFGGGVGLTVAMVIVPVTLLVCCVGGCCAITMVMGTIGAIVGTPTPIP